MPTGGNSGGYDLRIQQGDKPGDATWESPDIWVERAPYNDDKHIWDYDWNVDEDKPNYSGDKPKAGLNHRIWARVHCDGSTDARGVVVGFYAVSPPYVGYNGNWSTDLGHETGDIKAGSYTDFTAPVEWQPEVDDLTCIMVCIQRTTGEGDYSDNDAKEMVFDREMTVTEGTGVLNPIPETINVNNPLKVHAKVYLSADVDPGFSVHFKKSCLDLGPNKSASTDITIEPTDTYQAFIDRGQRYSRIRIIGYASQSNDVGSIASSTPDGSAIASAVPVDGITYWIALKTTTTISLKQDGSVSGDGTVKFKGSIDPATGKQEKLRVELYDSTGKLLSSVQRTAGTKGGFSAKFNSLGKGHYSIRAFLDNAISVASTASNVVEFDV